MHSQETKLYFAIIIAAIIIAIILIYFIVTIIRQQRRSFSLYQEKVETEINTLEKERSRVSRDLHDELGPLLLSVKYKLNSFDVDDPIAAELVKESDETLTRIIGRVREISNDLLPEILLRKGLSIAISDSISKITRQTNLAVDFQSENLPAISLEQSINIYRIVQEVLHNTLKHAKASRLQIELKGESEQLVLRTADNGCGFDEKAVLNDAKGIGLRSLLNRTEMLKGQMYLESAAGKGTRYIFEIPLQLVSA